MLRGSCLCGKVSYEISAAPRLMYHCHCGACRAASGAAYATNIVVPTDSLKFVTGGELLRAFESSAGKNRYFCSACGSPIYSHGQSTKEYVSVRSGTLKDDPDITPSYHAYVAYKAPWMVINDGLPQFPEARADVDHRQATTDTSANVPDASVKFDDLLFAFEFVDAMQPGLNEAYLCRETGVIHYHTDFGDNEEPLPDDIDNDEKYLGIPHKNDLALGKRLALRFADEFLPDAADDVSDIFRRKGAYGRFKDLLDRRNMLEQWYEYEQRSQEEALREWCRDNRIEVRD